MYLLKKSIKNLYKNMGRNIIIFILLFAVTLASVVSLTVYNITVKTKIETVNYYAGEVSLTGSRTENLTAEDYKNFVDSEYLKSYVFYYQMPVRADGLSLFDEENTMPEQEQGNGVRMAQADTQLIGMLDAVSMDEFSYGDRKISEGVFPANVGECMISTELAERNGTGIGDTITVSTVAGMESFDMTITALYEDNTVAQSNIDFPMSQFNRRNEIITVYEFFDGLNYPMQDYQTFLLKAPEDLEAFEEELHSKGLSDGLSLKYDKNRYNEAVEGIDEMRTIVIMFITVILIIGVGVVFLINMLALRERKYEIGVLRAVGMSKGRLMTLFLSEMLVLGLIGAVAALISGILVNPAAVEYMKKVMLGGHMPSALQAAIHSINPAFSVTVMLETILLVIAVVFVSCSMTILNITRFDPVKILSDRN